jgi:epoxyqueuosine reductase
LGTRLSERHLKQLLLDCASDLGLEFIGITSAMPFQRAEEAAIERLRKGLMGLLPWYTENRVWRGTRPKELLSDARSIISIAVDYLPETVEEGDGVGNPILACTKGRVARYAWGRDYHNVLKTRLNHLMKRFAEVSGLSFRFKVYVDDGPMIDREVAWRAGVGFYGKNTNVLTAIGSWVLLGQVITDLDLEHDQPTEKSCGTCVACIPACPTGAIVAPYVIDSNRCISYLTIENRGPIAPELRPLLGDWVFGCDICQEVCPVNQLRGVITNESEFCPEEPFDALELEEVLDFNEGQFREKFQGSPIRRATLTGLQRNACVVLGNSGDRSVVPVLIRALNTGSVIVRGHAAWALGRLGGEVALRALSDAQEHESDASVLDEIRLAVPG